MNTLSYFAAAGLAVAHVAFAPVAIAQEAKQEAAKGDAVDVQAKELVDKCRAAIAEVKDISCTVEQTTKADGEPQTFKGDVAASIIRVPGARGAGMLNHFKISVRGEDGETVWAFNGKNASRVEHGKKTFAAMEAPDGQAFPVAAAGQVFPSWTLRDVLNDPNAKIVQAKVLPDAQVSGVDCKVVEYTVEIPMMVDPDAPASAMRLKQIRHMGTEDLLPRRIESTVTYTGPMAGEMPTRTFIGVYTNVKANTNLADDAFTLKEPEGYKTVEADARDLGVPSSEPPKMNFAAKDQAPDFALKTPDGGEVTLASLKGKVVLLDFWATWCGPCKAAMPSIQKLHEKYQGKPVTILGVNTWERGPADIAKKYMDKNELTYGLLLKGDKLAEAYGISGIPTFVLIGPDGKIIHIGVGFGPGEDKHLEELIDHALMAS